MFCRGIQRLRVRLSLLNYPAKLHGRSMECLIPLGRSDPRRSPPGVSPVCDVRRGSFVVEFPRQRRTCSRDGRAQSLNRSKQTWKELSNGDSTGIPVDCFLLVQNQDVRRYKPRTRHGRATFAPRHTQNFILPYRVRPPKRNLYEVQRQC